MMPLWVTIFPVLDPFEDTPTSENWSPVQAARKRLDAVDLLAQTVEGIRETIGEPTEPMEETLARLREVLEEILVVAERLEVEMKEIGIQLNSAVPGGGKILDGKRGRPPQILSQYVKYVLMQRHPEWDGRAPFPGKNTRELRESLRRELCVAFLPPEDLDDSGEEPRQPCLTSLAGSPFYADSFVRDNLLYYLHRFAPFSDEDIDPRIKGPLWNMINNLQRLQ